jgi:hypothetical protein
MSRGQGDSGEEREYPKEGTGESLRNGERRVVIREESGVVSPTVIRGNAMLGLGLLKERRTNKIASSNPD